MIIECINCSKKFDVNSDLIPSTGRTIQCGSCNHVWFYKKGQEDSFIKTELKSKDDELQKWQKDLMNKETAKNAVRARLDSEHFRG